MESFDMDTFRPPIRRTRENIKGVLRDHKLLLLGFVLLFLWTWLFLQDSFIYADRDIAWGSGFFHPWSFSTGLFVVAFAIVGAASRPIDFNFRNRRVLVLAAVAMMLGAILILCSDRTQVGDISGNTLAIVGGIFVGVSTPVFYVEMVRFYLKLNLTQIITIGSAGTIIASILYGIIALFPFQAIACIVILLPCGMLVVLWPSSTDPASPAIRRANPKPLYIPWKLNATALVQGMGFGAGRWLLVGAHESGWLSGSENLMYLMGYVVAASLLICFVTLMHRKFDTLIYKIGFPLLAFGMLLLAIPALEGFGCFTIALGYRFIDLLIWALVAYLTITKNVSLNWLAGWSTACLYAGLTLGYFLIDFAMAILDQTEPQTIISFVAFILMFAALLITSTENDSKAWGSLRPSGVHISRPYFRDAVESLIRFAQLTDRQGEVFERLCQAKSKKEIASELYLSPETVKVHTRNIYRRFDVHSQQELRHMLEQEEARLST